MIDDSYLFTRGNTEKTTSTMYDGPQGALPPLVSLTPAQCLFASFIHIQKT
jgi:hypothetical protein